MCIRSGRFLLWLLVTTLVFLAIVVTSLRIALPQMNRFQDDIQHWVSQQAEIDFSLGHVNGYWRNTHPSLALENVQALLPDGSHVSASAQRIDIEFDLFRSLLAWQPVVADLTIHQLNVDIHTIDLLLAKQSDDSLSTSLQPNSEQAVLEQLDNLFLRQLDNFSVIDSQVLYRSLTGVPRRLDIQKLRWKNQGNEHRTQGVVSIADAGMKSLNVIAHFHDFGSFGDVSGHFYLSADKVAIRPWLTSYVKQQFGLDGGQVSLNAWLTVERGQPMDSTINFQPSRLTWSDATSHDLQFSGGAVQLRVDGNHWQVNSHGVTLYTDGHQWPELNLTADWSPQSWTLNVSQLQIARLLPALTLLSNENNSELASTSRVIGEWKPNGLLSDIRIKHDAKQGLSYSAQLKDGSAEQWRFLPEFHRLDAVISGTKTAGKVSVYLNDDQLPYGDLFQAPLNVDTSHIDLFWHQVPNGWSVWSDKLQIKNRDLELNGQFRLDLMNDRSPFLSLYSDVDIDDLSQAWRYLPVQELGTELTDYLSTAIQFGHAHHSKVLWYGELADFPYASHNGVFQAFVDINQGQFGFDTKWPSLSELQLDLLFENSAMYIDSHFAKLMDVTALRVTGGIPDLGHDAHLEIQASAVADGEAVRDFMLATPLVDSVGAALTAVKVSGEVRSDFQLNIPFDRRQGEPRAWGWADLNNNRVNIRAPEMQLNSTSGRIVFDNDVVKAKGLIAKLLDQSIRVDFRGESRKKGYEVAIDTSGDWEVKPLAKFVGSEWTSPLAGHAPWTMGVDIQLHSVGFTYQVDLSTSLNNIISHYPYPFDKQKGRLMPAHLQASGNQEQITARFELPQAKYQAEIDISQAIPILSSTSLVVGSGSFKISPIVGHSLQIRSDHFNLDQWIAFLGDRIKGDNRQQLGSNFPTIPIPDHAEIQVQELTVAGVEWHDVDFLARRKSVGWKMDLTSQEAKGEAVYLDPYDLSVALERLHLFIPALESDDDKVSGKIDFSEAKRVNRGEAITSLDRAIHKLIPNITLVINDFWLQGYKVGQLNMDFQRQGDRLNWKSIEMKSGSNQININGDWLLKGNLSHTHMQLAMKGDNNSDLMERFGVTSGIQKASFNLDSQLDWNGSPWSMQVSSLDGKLSTKLGKGVISDVSGAARLLGLFSFDSIIRKMKLDFSDVFDKGMAFNSITGSGKISRGVFVTNDISMDAVAGDMSIKGLVDLNRNNIDAEVNFVPDITSGIPVLSAFAVTPATALYVLAVTTVISPVVEVFTEVSYSVKGPIDEPVVKELSRRKGEFTLPENLRRQIK
jgi:uncharacterized protein (TIGR02099 family)